MTEFEAPQSRNEALLQNILGAENELEAPQSRNEKILHAILGEDIPLDPPQSRIEELLLEIKEQGIGGLTPYHVSDEYTLYGLAQAETLSDKDANAFKNSNSDLIIVSGFSEKYMRISGYTSTGNAYRTLTFDKTFVTGGSFSLNAEFGINTGGKTIKVNKVPIMTFPITVRFEFYSLESLLH